MRAISINVKQKKETLVYTVKWQKTQGGEELQCKSIEFPRHELLETLTAFGEFIPEICMIPKENLKWVKIAGATYEYDKNGFIFVSLGVAVGLTNQKELKFETPGLMVDYEHMDHESSSNWRTAYSALAKSLNDEILLYAQGKRAQGELFEDRNDEEN